MLVLDIPRRFNGRYIDIPPYHRTHLSLTAFSEVHVALVAGGDAVGPQLLISTVPFDRWNRLYRLTGYFSDRPGLLRSLYAALQRGGANILAAESAGVGQDGTHFVEVILDIGPGSDESRSAATLLRDVLSALIRDVELDETLAPRLKLRAIDALRGPASGTITQAVRHDSAKARKINLPGGRTVLRIHLPADIQKGLRDLVAIKSGVGSHSEGFYLRTSDTKDRFIRVMFFKGNDPVIHARLEHWDRVGALSAITAAAAEGGFDILTSMCALGESRGRAIFELVARYIGAADEEPLATEAVKRQLEECLGVAECRDLDLEISYPQDYVGPLVKRAVRPSTTEMSDGSDVVDLQGWLVRVIDDLEPARDVDSLGRREVARRLLGQFPGSDMARPRQRVFVSCHFADGSILEAAKAACNASGLTPVTGEHLEEDLAKVDGLRRLIATCDAFVGIWSDGGSQQTKEGLSPSPWLLWELGVAHAFEKEWRLVISRNIAPTLWQKISADRQHYLYREAEVESVLRKASTALRAHLNRGLPTAD